MKFLIIASGITNDGKFLQSCWNQTFEATTLEIVDEKKEGTVKCRVSRLEEMSSFKDYDVLVWADLDDELLPNAIERIAKEYEDENCWLTYGNYVDANGVVPYKDLSFPDDVTNFRAYDWRFVHLRTFRRELFQHLSLFDLYTDRELKAIPDANMLYSLMELAGREHMRHINEPIYKYNHNHAHTVVNSYSDEQIKEELDYVKSLTPLKQLEKL